MASVRMIRYDDGSEAFQWGEAGDPYVFDSTDEDSITVAFTKAVNDGVNRGDEIEGEAAQAVAEVLKAAGAVAWNDEYGLNDWRSDLAAQLPGANYADLEGGGGTYYYIEDISLDGSKALICGCEKGDPMTWVAPITVANGDPVLGARPSWVEVEQQYVEKAGRQFSNRNFDAMRAAHEALGKLIAAGETERAPKVKPEGEEEETEKKLDGPEMSYSITKATGSMRYTLGPLYAPMRKDAHGEYIEDDVLHKSLHEYVRDSSENGRRIMLQHGVKGDIQVGEWVEAVRWPYEHTIKMRNPATGDEHEVDMPEGTIYLGVVWDEDYWDAEANAPKGLNGYSLGGRAMKVRDGGDAGALKDMGYKVSKATAAAVEETAEPAAAPVAVEEDTEAALEIVKRQSELQAENAALKDEQSEHRSLLRRTLDVLEKQAERELPETHIHLPEQNVTINEGASPVDDLLAPDE